MKCPKCGGYIIIERQSLLVSVKAVRCLICGYWTEEGYSMNKSYHAAWVKEDNPRAGIVKERNYVTR